MALVLRWPSALEMSHGVDEFSSFSCRSLVRPLASRERSATYKKKLPQTEIVRTLLPFYREDAKRTPGLGRALGTTHKRLQTQEQLQKRCYRRAPLYNHLHFSAD